MKRHKIRKHADCGWLGGRTRLHSQQYGCRYEHRWAAAQHGRRRTFVRFRSCCSISCRHVQWETLTPLPTAVREHPDVGQWESSQALLSRSAGGRRSVPSLESYCCCSEHISALIRAVWGFEQPLMEGCTGRQEFTADPASPIAESPSCPSPSSPRALGQRRPTALPNDHEFCQR